MVENKVRENNWEREGVKAARGYSSSINALGRGKHIHAILLTKVSQNQFSNGIRVAFHNAERNHAPKQSKDASSDCQFHKIAFPNEKLVCSGVPIMRLDLDRTRAADLLPYTNAV